MIFSEIADRGSLTDCMQERSVFDGRWKMIYRENILPAWRQVQADSKFLKVWGNRTYDETFRVRDRFPEPYRILAEMDPQSLGGTVKAIELYDLKADPDEMHDLAGDAASRSELDRLYQALRVWVRKTEDPSVNPPELLLNSNPDNQK